MPLQLPNWFQAQIQDHYGQMIPSFTGGLKSGYDLARMQRMGNLEEQKARLMNAYYQNKLPLQEQEIKRGAMGLEYYPEELKHSQFKRQLERQYLPQESQLAIENSRYKNAQEAAKAKYAEEAQLADIEATKQRMLTPTEKIAARLYPGDEKAQQEYLKLTSGITSDFDEKGALPPGTVPIISMPKISQNAAVNENRKVLNRANIFINVNKKLDTLESLINKHPNIAESLSRVIMSDDPNSTWDKIKRVGLGQGKLSRNDVAAIEQMNKLYSDIALYMTQAIGDSGKVTDMLRGMVKSAKGSTNISDQAARLIINNLRAETIPYVAAAPIYQKNLYRYAMPFNVADWPKTKQELLQFELNNASDEELEKIANGGK